MPTPAVRAETPPQDLRDRNEGWGQFGGIFLYPSYKDTGTWPATVEGHTSEDWPPELSDIRDGGWWVADGLDVEEVNP